MQGYLYVIWSITCNRKSENRWPFEFLCSQFWGVSKGTYSYSHFILKCGNKRGRRGWSVYITIKLQKVHRRTTPSRMQMDLLNWSGGNPIKDFKNGSQESSAAQPNSESSKMSTSPEYTHARSFLFNSYIASIGMHIRIIGKCIINLWW